MHDCQIALQLKNKSKKQNFNFIKKYYQSQRGKSEFED